MALPTVSPAPQPSPQVVGNAFIQQYYKILHESPESVHKFYKDSSILCRPDSNGVMTSVTTMEAINELIVSLDLSICYTEIETMDSQLSYNDGMLIVVTGSFTGKDNTRRKFAQSFFLAPQEHGGYFVLNDVFRVLNETQARETVHVSVNDSNNDASTSPLATDLELTLQDHHVGEAQVSVAEADNNDETFEQQEDITSGTKDEVPVGLPVHVDESAGQLVSNVTTAVMPKKTYASILQLKALKAKTSLEPVYESTRKAKMAPVGTEEPAATSIKVSHSHESSITASNVAPENSPLEEGYSIYIRNLPMNATAEQVEAELKRFGTIRPGGVQVRRHKVDAFCFGFVEFDSLTSMQAAIEASPIMIGGRQAYIEEKRTTTRVVNGVVLTSGNGAFGRGRIQPGRGGFRNDNFRGRGNFSPHSSYRRNDFRNQGEFSGRGHTPSFRGRGRYQHQFYQSTTDRIGRPNVPKQTAIVAK